MKGTKVCRKCGKNRQYRSYHKDKTRRDGHHAVCKYCRCKYGGRVPYKKCETCGKSFKPANLQAIAQKYCSYMCSPHSNTRLDLTSQEWWDKYNEQDGSCEICGDNDCKLVVDHDHETNCIRSLLCNRCNIGLGAFKDNPKLMNKAASYIDYWNGFQNKPL